MRRFSEFVSQRDGVQSDSSQPTADSSELLQRIVHNHGARFGALLKNIITNGDVEDDPELLNDLKQLSQTIASSAPDDQHPIRDKKPNREPDIVSRPKADGGGSGGPVGAGGAD
jgi:hypothetical protein